MSILLHVLAQPSWLGLCAITRPHMQPKSTQAIIADEIAEAYGRRAIPKVTSAAPGMGNFFSPWPHNISSTSLQHLFNIDLNSISLKLARVAALAPRVEVPRHRARGDGAQEPLFAMELNGHHVQHN
jgi:hypothetical protein